MLDGALFSVFQTYPVLARLMTTAMIQWIGAVQEFLTRLDDDREIIQSAFSQKQPLGRIEAIQPGLSDFHNGGRMVLAMRFESGFKLVYKPKNMGLDAAYCRFMAWINAHEVPLPFYVPGILDRTTHGWMEYIEHVSCKSRDEAERYYKRAGMLLCLLHVLDTIDCHHDNLIASGEYPVLVDMETVMHPHVPLYHPGESTESARRLAISRMENSALRVGLLPIWSASPFARGVDISGLGGVEEQQDASEIIAWEHVNTDRMRPVKVPGTIQMSANAPYLGEQPLFPGDFVDQILFGFRSMYRWLMGHRDALLATAGPLSSLVRQRVRFVFRSTSIYLRLLNKLYHPTYLKHGIERGIQLDVLCRAHLDMADPDPPFWPIFRAEIDAMERMDVPYFTASANDDGLSTPSGDRIERCFEASPGDRVRRRIKHLSREDLDNQLDMIQASFFARTAPSMHGVTADLAQIQSTESQPAPNPEPLVAYARVISGEIQRRAIRSSTGGASWIAPIYSLAAHQYRLQPIGYDLYNGCSGVALFLAAFGSITGDEAYQRLSLGAFEAVRDVLQDERHLERFVRYEGIGGAAGLGAIVYGLVRAGRWLDEPSLIEQAIRAASLITIERIGADTQLDVISGAAGALLGLLALYRQTGDAGILERATACGRHLVGRRVDTGSGFRGWNTIESHPLSGFSHGAAGIAYALLRLYEITEERAFIDAAEEGIRFEQTLYRPEAGNWLDLRGANDEGGTLRYMTSWCNGAPGIGLARIGGLSWYDTPSVRQDIEAALETTMAYGLESRDHLCCGNMGRIELLITAAGRLNRPELAATARKQAGWIAKRATQNGSYLLNGGVSRGAIYDPGFFSGHAGIGYQMLRLAYPDRLPSILLWE